MSANARTHAHTHEMRSAPCMTGWSFNTLVLTDYVSNSSGLILPRVERSHYMKAYPANWRLSILMHRYGKKGKRLYEHVTVCECVCSGRTGRWWPEGWVGGGGIKSTFIMKKIIYPPVIYPPYQWVSVCVCMYASACVRVCESRRPVECVGLVDAQCNSIKRHKWPDSRWLNPPFVLKEDCRLRVTTHTHTHICTSPGKRGA